MRCALLWAVLSIAVVGHVVCAQGLSAVKSEPATFYAGSGRSLKLFTVTARYYAAKNRHAPVAVFVWMEASNRHAEFEACATFRMSIDGSEVPAFDALYSSVDLKGRVREYLRFAMSVRSFKTFVSAKWIEGVVCADGFKIPHDVMTPLRKLGESIPGWISVKPAPVKILEMKQ